MRDVLPDIERWRTRGERVAIATVVSMAGSAPRRPGAKLVVSESGELAGSVSGGCVEPAVFEGACTFQIKGAVTRAVVVIVARRLRYCNLR